MEDIYDRIQRLLDDLKKKGKIISNLTFNLKLINLALDAVEKDMDEEEVIVELLLIQYQIEKELK